jgi:hypothetical protein
MQRDDLAASSCTIWLTICSIQEWPGGAKMSKEIAHFAARLSM